MYNSCHAKYRLIWGVNLPKTLAPTILLHLSQVTAGSEETSDATVRKVHAEYNYITRILFEELYQSRKLLLLSKDVNISDFPDVFRNQMFLEFPNGFSREDERFESVVKRLRDGSVSHLVANLDEKDVSCQTEELPHPF